MPVCVVRGHDLWLFSEWTMDLFGEHPRPSRATRKVSPLPKSRNNKKTQVPHAVAAPKEKHHHSVVVVGK